MTVNGLEIEVEYKCIKNVHLSVYPPDGRVHVSVPNGYGEERIRMYILQKWVWIEEKREMLSSYNRLPEREYISGETHYFKGTKYRLKVNRRPSGAYSVHIEGDYIVVDVHRDTSAAIAAITAITAVSARYERTLPSLEADAHRYENEVNGYLKEMGFIL